RVRCASFHHRYVMEKVLHLIDRQLRKFLRRPSVTASKERQLGASYLAFGSPEPSSSEASSSSKSSASSSPPSSVFPTFMTPTIVRRRVVTSESSCAPAHSGSISSPSTERWL